VHVKSSLGVQQPSLRYQLESLTLKGVETARISSRGFAAVEAADLLAPAPDPGSAIADAMQLLRTELAEGQRQRRRSSPRPTSSVSRERN